MRPPPQAEVVGAPLQRRVAQLGGARHARGLQRPRRHLHVLPRELLLQPDGVGGHHDACVVPQREGRGRQQVRHALADARPCLHNEVVAPLERLGHRRQHPLLLDAVLEARRDRRQRAVQPHERRRHRRRVVRQRVVCPIASSGRGRPSRCADAPFEGERVHAAEHRRPGHPPRGLLRRNRVEEAGQRPVGDACQPRHLRDHARVHVQRNAHEPVEHLLRRDGVVQAAVCAPGRYPQRARQHVQRVVAARQQHRREVPRVEHRAGETHARLLEETDVELDVMSDHRRVANEVAHLAGDGGKRLGRVHLGLLDAGEPLDEGRELPLGVRQAGERVHNVRAPKLDGANLDDEVLLRVEARRLEIEAHEGVVEGKLAGGEKRH